MVTEVKKLTNRDLMDHGLKLYMNGNACDYKEKCNLFEISKFIIISILGIFILFLMLCCPLVIASKISYYNNFEKKLVDNGYHVRIIERTWQGYKAKGIITGEEIIVYGNGKIGEIYKVVLKDRMFYLEK